MKKVLSIITSLSITIGLLAAPSFAEGFAADNGYGKLDLSLTKTVYNSIGQEGKVIAAVVNEKTVNMYKNPCYGSYNLSSAAYYAVKVDADTKEYIREGEKEDIIRPQRTILTEGLTYSVDNTAVIALNSDGSFVTSGYGMANITVVYDAGTAEDASDDVTNSVTVICSDDHRMSVGQEFWTNSSSGNSFFRLHEFVDGTWKNDGGDYRWGLSRSSTAQAYRGFRLNWDPLGDSDSPLVIEAFAEQTGLLTPAATHAERVGGYIKNSPVVMHAWFYDSMNLVTAGTAVNFLSFGYSGTTTQGEKSYVLSGYNNATSGINAYRLAGGDYTTRIGAKYFTSKSKDTSASTTVKAEENPSGVINVAERTKGWHQFVVTAEPSLVNPGTDYLLTKVYLDGKLVTSQDIYVGNIPVEERQCNVRVYNSKVSAGTVDTENAFNKALTCYKDIYVAGYKISEKITDSIPSNGAKNVPLYHPVRIKLGAALNSVDDVNITFKKGNTETSFSAQLDETKTVLTLDAGKYDVNAAYTVAVDGEGISFTTGENTEMASVIDDMKTDKFVLSTARYIDFEDEAKAVEEYGVGLSFNTAASELDFSDGVLTLREGVRAKEFSDSSNCFNALLVRNLTEYNNKAERVIVSYKVKFDGIGSTQKNRGHAAGFSVPVMAAKNEKDSYNPTLRSWMPTKGGSKTNGRPYIETESAAGYTVRHLLVANNLEGVTGSKGQTEGTSAAPQSQFSIGQTTGMSLQNQIDAEGYIRFTYVIDVDPKGEKKTTWRYVIGDDLHFLNRIFAAYECNDDILHTGVDSLYIPLTNANYSIQEKNESSMLIKDIQIYTLSKNLDATVSDTVTVTKTGTDETVYSDNLKNVTVDASIKASGSGSYTAIFAVYDSTDNMLHAVKTVNGEFTESESEIKAEGIIIPDEENLMLYAYVWSTLDDTVVIKKKIPYSAVTAAE